MRFRKMSAISVMLSFAVTICIGYASTCLASDTAKAGEADDWKFHDIVDLALVQQHERASISMLQRQLRIGYSRAARLIETMEKQGVIGPAPGGSGTREVLQTGAAPQPDEQPASSLPPL